MADLVQAGGLGNTSTLPGTATAGNTLVAIGWDRSGSDGGPTVPDGYTLRGRAEHGAGLSIRSVLICTKVADGTEISATGGALDIKYLLTEWTGEYAGIVETQDAVASTTAMDTGGAVTPTAGEAAVLIGAAGIGTSDFDSVSVAPDSGSTELVDTFPSGESPHVWAGYRAVANPTTSYTVSGVISTAKEFSGVTIVLTGPAVPPEPGVWMDWNGDGFDATASTDSAGLLARIFPEAGPAGVSDNVTDRVLAIDWERGGSYDSVSPAGPGGATIVLKNHDGRFDPDNASGPLFGKLKPGIPVWCGADRTTASLTTATEVRGFFAGYVREWVPTVDSRGERVVEVICEDAFGRYRRTPVTVSASLTRSQSDLRQAILTAAGESSDRLALASEPGMLPISAVDGEDALSVLEDLNKATASRHYIAPADTKEAWYDYTLVNRYHKLADAVDETWNGDDIQNVSGWRVTNANVIEQQRASVTPITLTPNNAVVWEAEGLPVTVRHVRPYTVIAEFDDYVFGPTLDIGVVSGSVYSEIEGFGKTARIRIWSAVLGVVGSIRVLGQQVERGDSEQVIAGDSSAGALTGSPINSDYIGQTAAAQGVCDYIVWKFSTPLKRPKLVRKRKDATTTASIFDRDLFDVVGVVIDELSVTSRRLEIVGLKGSWKPGRDISMTYECQETPNQSPVQWFTVGTDTVGSSVPIAPF